MPGKLSQSRDGIQFFKVVLICLPHETLLSLPRVHSIIHHEPSDTCHIWGIFESYRLKHLSLDSLDSSPEQISPVHWMRKGCCGEKTITTCTLMHKHKGPFANFCALLVAKSVFLPEWVFSLSGCVTRRPSKGIQPFNSFLDRLIFTRHKSANDKVSIIKDLKRCCF